MLRIGQRFYVSDPREFFKADDRNGGRHFAFGGEIDVTNFISSAVYVIRVYAPAVIPYDHRYMPRSARGVFFEYRYVLFVLCFFIFLNVTSVSSKKFLASKFSLNLI